MMLPNPWRNHQELEMDEEQQQPLTLPPTADSPSTSTSTATIQTTSTIFVTASPTLISFATSLPTSLPTFPSRQSGHPLEVTNLARNGGRFSIFVRADSNDGGTETEIVGVGDPITASPSSKTTKSATTTITLTTSENHSSTSSSKGTSVSTTRTWAASSETGSTTAGGAAGGSPSVATTSAFGTASSTVLPESSSGSGENSLSAGAIAGICISLFSLGMLGTAAFILLRRRSRRRRRNRRGHRGRNKHLSHPPYPSITPSELPGSEYPRPDTSDRAELHGGQKGTPTTGWGEFDSPTLGVAGDLENEEGANHGGGWSGRWSERWSGRNSLLQKLAAWTGIGRGSPAVCEHRDEKEGEPTRQTEVTAELDGMARAELDANPIGEYEWEGGQTHGMGGDGKGTAELDAGDSDATAQGVGSNVVHR
ncbi:hypothetical protein MKZ38_001085 [Zalerion maritima]|uniref:Uncharacterized protein n=1 Tax=Zalerion maritima TaxID=339359 RepID=A0AAD5RQR7_9PEZI|nr:hypothetical protein MKZ38_001085 [Zalerion maritima]